jgi:DNA-binding NtrC family response regulator
MSDNMTDRNGVLMVDDEENFLLTASVSLKAAGIDPVWTISDSREVLPFLEKNRPGVIVLDLTMPHLTGRDLLPRIADEHPGIPVIILTAHDDLDMAVGCMRSGARDYLVKPVEETRLIGSIKSQLEVVDLRQEMQTLKESFLSGSPPEGTGAFDSIVTDCERIRSLFAYIRAVAPSQHPVLISGETGTGKELFARAVHEQSGFTGEYVAVNVAGLDDTHFTDTLFGHEKGAYTGADRARNGLVSTAANGTLFLDEIGDLAESSQVKLLRLLQERQYYPLGSDVAKPSRARIVVATNRSVHEMVRSGRFRKDLYFRLRTHEVAIPALRERSEDLPLLLDHFLEKAGASFGKKVPSYPKELITLLGTYNFPGNVRELEGFVDDAMARHQSGVLSMDSFKAAMSLDMSMFGDEPVQVNEMSGSAGGSDRFSFSGSFPSIKEVEEFLIDQALDKADGNQTIAAQMLGITRQTLNKRLTRSKKDSS